MCEKLRGKQLLFMVLVISSFMITLLLSAHKKQRLSHRVANSIAAILSSTQTARQHVLPNIIAGKNTTSYLTRLPCFTVGFKSPPKVTGIGNHLFYYAAVMYTAWLTGRKPLILSSEGNKLDNIFNLDIVRLDNNALCPVKQFMQEVVYAYNESIRLLNNVEANVSIWLRGPFCSWKYTQPIERQLRRKLLFHRRLEMFAESYLSTNIPPTWNASTFVRVGVHMRRGDFLRSWAVHRGFTVAGKEYVKRAMMYFIKRYPRVQFIVTSNDIDWCYKNINPSSFSQPRVNITFSHRQSAEQDFVLLTRCDHVIMTTGTYGWWAAWLANGTTIYYKDFPRHGSWLWKRTKADEYFPPTWIGMK